LRGKGKVKSKWGKEEGEEKNARYHGFSFTQDSQKQRCLRLRRGHSHEDQPLFRVCRGEGANCPLP